MMTTTSMLWIILWAQPTDAVAQDGFAVVPDRTIRVETIEEPLDTPVSRFVSLIERPRFAATIVLRRGIGNTERLDSYRTTRLRGKQSGGEKFRIETGMSGLSDAQIALMETSMWIEGYWFDPNGIRSIRGTYGARFMNPIAKRFQRYAEEGTVFYTVYGVTRDDAIAVARAAVDLIDAKTRETIEKRKASLRQKREKAVSESARLAAAKQKAAGAQSRLDAAREVVLYADVDQAAADVAELSKSTRQTEIEMVGIRAKQAAIDGFKARKGIDIDARTMLDRMTMQLDIEMAGALARTDSLRRHRKSAETSRHALGELRDAKAVSDKWTPKLKRTERDVESLVEKLTNPSDADKPVMFVDDKIIVQAIRYTD